MVDIGMTINHNLMDIDHLLKMQPQTQNNDVLKWYNVTISICDIRCFSDPPSLIN